MTRDDASTMAQQRAACIKAMAMAVAVCKGDFIVWDSPLDSLKQQTLVEHATAALDALPTAGACVVPIEATEEMIEAGDLELSEDGGYSGGYTDRIFSAMAAAGDLTNGPEGKT